MKNSPFAVSVRELAIYAADNSCLCLPLQELLEVALFHADVRVFASPKNSKENSTMKRIIIIAVFTCALSVQTLAGNIPTVGVTPPPDPEEVQATTLTSSGEIPSVGLTQQMSEAALMLVQLMLGSIV
jgi:hypothetical protein